MKLWKKRALALTVAVGLLSSSSPIFAAAPSGSTPSSDTQVSINGKRIADLEGESMIQKGVTLVPLRSTTQALGAKLSSVRNSIVTITVNGKAIKLPTKAKVISGVSFVPIRELAEATGYSVKWDQKTRTVQLISKSTGQAARGFLWEVKNEGATVYLVGSIHVADDSFYPLRKEFQQAFDAADYLGVEIDLSKTAEVQPLLSELGMYPAGTTLQDHIPATTYKQLGNLLKKNGLQANAFDQFKPWLAETMLNNLKTSDSGYEASQGIDQHFIEQANERKLPILALESYRSQFSVFSGMSEQLQQRNLQAAITNFDTVVDGTDQLATMWKNGDEASLLALTDSISADPEYGKALLIDRNIGMAEKIDGYLRSGKNQTYLIVVGAAHYLGEDGVLKLLQNKGYTVSRK
ncbi:TraB/GumN family protein [Saccharibacillus sp. JS10]|uniref:TraB/GumN family protein n=1 Tax=Saccharibacillus sp. JS10 TaxID=2950552 RepID=UPI00210C889C|nr:TraB/GumN family protein [Saccharibacillus sp. JS10]MCQ4087342.1 TraB/GumN family protein [Saccharibacillus sp. JS10]